MNMLTETPSKLALFFVVFVVSIVMGVRERKLSLVDLAPVASAMAALSYIAADIATRGVSPFLVIGLGDVFLLYPPLSFFICLACRALLRRRLYVFRGATGT